MVWVPSEIVSASPRTKFTEVKLLPVRPAEVKPVTKFWVTSALVTVTPPEPSDAAVAVVPKLQLAPVPVLRTP